jgi:hypothetical protein
MQAMFLFPNDFNDSVGVPFREQTMNQSKRRSAPGFQFFTPGKASKQEATKSSTKQSNSILVMLPMSHSETDTRLSSAHNRQTESINETVL